MAHNNRYLVKDVHVYLDDDAGLQEKLQEMLIIRRELEAKEKFSDAERIVFAMDKLRSDVVLGRLQRVNDTYNEELNNLNELRSKESDVSSYLLVEI